MLVHVESSNMTWRGALVVAGGRGDKWSIQPLPEEECGHGVC